MLSPQKCKRRSYTIQHTVDKKECSLVVGTVGVQSLAGEGCDTSLCCEVEAAFLECLNASSALSTLTLGVTSPTFSFLIAASTSPTLLSMPSVFSDPLRQSGREISANQPPN